MSMCRVFSCVVGRGVFAMTSAFSWQKEMIKKTNYELCAYYTRFCAKCGICAKLLQQCLTVCEPMFCSFPRSSVHGISRQEYWSGFPFPSPGIFPTQILNSRFSCLLHWQADSLQLVPPGKPKHVIYIILFIPHKTSIIKKLFWILIL